MYKQQNEVFYSIIITFNRIIKCNNSTIFISSLCEALSVHVQVNTYTNKHAVHSEPQQQQPTQEEEHKTHGNKGQTAGRGLIRKCSQTC